MHISRDMDHVTDCKNVSSFCAVAPIFHLKPWTLCCVKVKFTQMGIFRWIFHYLSLSLSPFFIRCYTSDCWMLTNIFCPFFAHFSVSNTNTLYICNSMEIIQARQMRPIPDSIYWQLLLRRKQKAHQIWSEGWLFNLCAYRHKSFEGWPLI